MHPLGEEEDLITKEIIGKAIAIHRVLGPGLLESVYEYFLAHELRKCGLQVEQQKPIPVEYDSEIVDPGFRPDLIVNGEVIVEWFRLASVKSVKSVNQIHRSRGLARRLICLSKGNSLTPIRSGYESTVANVE